MGFNEVKKTGLIKLIKNTKASIIPLTIRLGIIYPNNKEVPIILIVRFKRRRVNKNGKGIPGFYRPCQTIIRISNIADLGLS